MASGLKGPLDFVGYSTGSPPGLPAALAGFVGLLDFVGFPIGASAVAAAEAIRLVRGPLPKKKRRRKHDDEEELLLLI